MVNRNSGTSEHNPYLVDPSTYDPKNISANATEDYKFAYIKIFNRYSKEMPQ